MSRPEVFAPGGWYKTPLGITWLTHEQAQTYREQPCVPVKLGPPKQIKPKL